MKLSGREKNFVELLTENGRLRADLERVEANRELFRRSLEMLTSAFERVEGERDTLRAAAQKASDEMPCVSDVLGGPVCAVVGRGLCTFCELRAVLAGSGQVEAL